MLVIAALALAIAWARERGYQIADSVEYMERARAIARGEALIDNQAIRGWGFSAILMPIFFVARLFGLDSVPAVLVACQLVQIAFALALVWATVHLGTQIGGRTAGLAAGLALALNPILLRWGVEPVSGVAGGLFIALGLRVLFSDVRTWRAGMKSGLWFGAGLLMAYQTFSIVAAVVVYVVLRDRWRARRHSLGLSSGIILCVLIQCALDQLYYGSFGVSVSSYLFQNFGTQGARLVYEIGRITSSDTIVEWSRQLYNNAVRLEESDIAIQYQNKVKQAAEVIRQSHRVDWYLSNLARGVPLAAAALVVVGALRSLFVRSWSGGLLIFVLATNVIAYSLKGSKDFRLWLPLLPLIAALAGLGFAWIAGIARPRTGALSPLRFTAALALLVLACTSGVRENWRTNTRRFAAFWDAMAFVNSATTAEARRVAAAGFTPARPLVSCAYHWAAFLRGGSDDELIKLPHHLDYWNGYTSEQRAADLVEIAGLEYFITHLPVLTEHPDLMEAVNRDFAVRAVFFDRVSYEGLGPIYVLKKRSGAADERTLFDTYTKHPLEAYAAERELDLDRALWFCDPRELPPSAKLALIDWNYEPIDGDGHGWMTYTWYGGPFEGVDWTFVDRMTSREPARAWQNNHAPAYGMRPTSTWESGTILREGYLVVAEADPFRPTGPTYFLGGSYRRGDLMPLTLWMDAAQIDPQGKVSARLDACAEGRILRETALAGRPPAWRGECVSHDGMARAGVFWLEVPGRARVADDGRPVPDEQ